MYKYEYLNTVGNMSIRPAPNVNNSPVGTLPVNVKGYGDELAVLTNGDKWLKILQGGSAVGYVAVIHNGKPYGTLTEIPITPDPEPEVPVFPEYFILTDPQGNKAHYDFNRILP